MGQFWQDMRTHRLTVALFLFFWPAAWWTMNAVWMPWMLALNILLLLLPPVVAGFIVGWWRQTSPKALAGLLSATWAGLVAMEALLVINAVIGATWNLWLTPQPSPQNYDEIRESLLEVWILMIVLIPFGLMLGTAGGLIGGPLGQRLRRRRDRPAVPPPMT